MLSIVRFIIPAITLIILAVCFGSLIVNRPKPQILAKLVNMDTGDIFFITHWESSIGRYRANDIIINDKNVAKFQAVITKERSEWRIVNTARKGSVAVNGEQGRSIELGDGDIIRFGHATWKFICEEAIKREEKMQIRKEILSNQQQGRSNAGPVIATLWNKKTQQVYYIRNNRTVIGSARDCDVCIKNSSVNPHHVIIEREPNRWSIRDLNGENKTLLNKESIKILSRNPSKGYKAIDLENQDIITLGDLVFVFGVYD